MSKIIPKVGTTYTIVADDTLWDIATVVYGSGRKYEVIYDANKSNLRSGDPNLIYPGEKIFIPPDPKKGSGDVFVYDELILRETGHGGPEKIDPMFIGLEIEGVPVPTEAMMVVLTLDTPSNGWNATVRHNGKKDHTYELFRPYQYQDCRVTIGRNYIGDTNLYVTNPDWTSSMGKNELKGYCPTVDFIDSVTDGPYQADDITFADWITKKAAPFGLSVDFDIAEDKKYKRVKMKRDEKAFSYFNKLARERGYLIGNTMNGGLYVFDAPSDGPIVAHFSENGANRLLSGSAMFDGRRRFRRTRGYGSGPRKNIAETIIDEYLARERMQSTTVNNSKEEDLLDAVRAASNRGIEEALTITVPIRDFYNENGTLYWPGQFVSYQSDRIYLDEPFIFLIRDVEFIQNGSKRSGNLTLVPPTVYTKGDLEIPWSSAR